ncbi:MAG: hypothetical protein J0H12_06840 [Candidatus Paracaedimonas acanthamoebae]|uniref:Uncharacterized protein n=1 Tax=Candidatus Paracaedimonas acanthamoebae TaxID=244581 RepID=A0A8J7PTK6_9PROT|nr:hypothetical protein [Candidatus Paracaedimonas acanthamoebae]
MIIVVFLIPSSLLASTELIKEENNIRANSSRRDLGKCFEVDSKYFALFLSKFGLNIDKKFLEIGKDDKVSGNANLKERIILNTDDFIRVVVTLPNKNRWLININRQIIHSLLNPDLRDFSYQLRIADSNSVLYAASRLASENLESNKHRTLIEEVSVSTVKSFKTHYSGIEINEGTAVVSLREAEWKGIPLAFLIFEKINSIEDVLEFNCYTFRPQSIPLSTQEYIEPFFSSSYSKGKGNIMSISEKQVPSEWGNVTQTGVDWKLDSFYVDNALSCIRRMQDKDLSFVFESEYEDGKLKLPSKHYTSASFAVYILREYCYITGFDREPFKSDLSVNSLMKIAQNVSPNSYQKPCENEIGSLIKLLYHWIR